MSIERSSEYLFLYGTLMRGLGAMDSLAAASCLRFLRKAQVRGQLYDLGSYPGLLPGQGQVCGEVYEVLDPQIWSILDPYEDYFPGDETGSLYLREQLELSDGSGRVWTYIYNNKVDEGSLVADGDWRRYWLEKRQNMGV